MMFTEARKLRIIENIISLKSESTLVKIEEVLQNMQLLSKKNRVSAHEFLGLISAEDIALIEQAIKEGEGF